MITKQYFFNKKRMLPVDKFIGNILFDKRNGYYSSKFPFGYKGDFITAPGMSNLFSEIIAVWLISTWNEMGKPKTFNIVELGPGDGNLTKILIRTFKRFSEFDRSKKIFLYEKSNLLKKLQKRNINSSKVKWISNFRNIKDGPVIFFGNEFFDAIPIKQFVRKKNVLFEKYYFLSKKNKIRIVYKKALPSDVSKINKFKSLGNLKFIEFPKLGLSELGKMVQKILQLEGGLLLIDYGNLSSKNKDTLQSVINHKKNKLFENLGKADITSLVNFDLLKEYFFKKNLKLKKITTQKNFLERMGIIERANNLSIKMKFKEQTNLYLRLKRLLDTKSMGNLFKVIFAYKSKNTNFLGFD